MDAFERLLLKLSLAEEDGNIRGVVVETLSFQDKMEALPIAAREGLYKIMVCLLEHLVADVLYVDGHQNNLMHKLLNSYDKHFNPDRRDLFLHCVVKLVDAGVDVNQVNGDKETPIFIAARQGLYEVVMYLLEHGVEVHYIDGRHNNLIHLLLFNYDSHDKRDIRDLLLQCIYKSVDAGVDVNQVNEGKDTPVFIAAREGLYEVVIYLLEHGVEIHCVDDRHNNLIHLLLYSYNKYQKLDRRDLLLQCIYKSVDAGVDVNQVNEGKDTPVFIAAREGLCEIVIYLLEHGVEIHCVDGHHNNLIHILLYSYNKYQKPDRRDLLLQCIYKSVDAGVDVNQVNDDRNTPIFIAAGLGLYEVVMYLLKHEVDIHYIDLFKNNLIHQLVHRYEPNRHEPDRLDLLLQCIYESVDAGVDVNQVNEGKDTPVFIAAREGLCEIVIYLLEHGVEIHCVDGRHNNLIHILLYSYNKYQKPDRLDLLLQCIYKLVDAGVDFNQVNYSKDTPVFIAARQGLYEAVIYMLEHSLEIHYVDDHHNNLIHFLLNSYNNHQKPDRRDLILQCVVKLVDAGVDVNQVNEGKDTPVFIAAREGLYEVVIYLLEHGVEIHCVDGRHNNLIHLLLYSYNKYQKLDRRDLLLQCIYKSVDAGVDVNQVNEGKDTPVFIAAREGLCEIVIYLLEHGVEIHCVDGRHNNLIHILLYSYNKYQKPDRRDLLLQCIYKSVDAGVDVNQVNDDRNTPIFIAAGLGLYEVVMYLLKHEVDIHYIDLFKNNLIHQLVHRYEPNRHEPDRLDLLLQCIYESVDAGVDFNQENYSKDTPVFIAARKGLYEVVIYMLEHSLEIHYVDDHHNNLIHFLLNSYNNHQKPDRRDLILQCVVKLVDAGVDVNQVNEGKDTPVFIAAREGLYEVVIYLLEHGVEIHRVDYCYNNLLQILLCNYDKCFITDRRDLLLQCIYKSVDAGVDVNQVNDDRNTPIFIAARLGLYEVVMYLLKHEVNIHYIDAFKNNLIHQLVPSYEPDRRDLFLQCLVKLVDAGVDVNQLNDDKDTSIIIAAKLGLHEVVMYLLEHGVFDVHCIDGLKHKILHYVLGYIYSYEKFEEKYIQLVDTLIKTVVDINQPDDKGNTPLFNVGMHTSLDDTLMFNLFSVKGIMLKLKTRQEQDLTVPLKCKLINMLLDAGCNVNHQNQRGKTALMHHMQDQSSTSILKLLIPHSDLSLTDNNGHTAIDYCIQYHMINSGLVFKLLVDSSTDLISGDNGIKFFHDILKCKRLPVLSYSIRQKLIVNGVTAEGENMLHLLAGFNYDYSLCMFKWLLNSELDINHPCSKTNTPTMVAAFLLNSKYLELLTRHPRLEINMQNNLGHTALHLCIIGFTMFKDGLNKRQVNDDVQNYCGQIYPIYMACIDNLLGVDGIDVNIPDNGGRTSLMMAAMKNDRVLTRKLLQAGAIVTMLDNSGRSALQYLNIYQSVFDLTCFKLLLSNGNTSLLNLPCIDGNTIIQTVLCFPFFWEPYCVVRFIRYLVAENCCVQTLITSSGESSYNQIDLTELSSSDRDKLRRLLYLSGAQGEEIMTALNFDEEDHTTHSRGREEFTTFCNNEPLKSLCRRSIRKNLGLGIKEKFRDLELPGELYDFLQLNDIVYPKDYNVDYIDDGCNDFDDDDDYDGYDIDKDRDDDYSQYNYQYVTLKMDHELTQDCIKNNKFPNGDNIR